MNFTGPYDRKEYLDFFQQFLLTDNFVKKSEKLILEYKPLYLKNAAVIGEDSSLELKVIEIEHDSENDPRVGISKDIFRMMAHYYFKRVLAVIKSKNSSNYRLSLATVELSLDGSKVKRSYSNPKRYSFFLGMDSKTHTPEQFLIKKGKVVSFEDLQSRFSVEVVNKEFYYSIARQFSELVGGQRKNGSQLEEFNAKLKLPATTDHDKLQEFAVRLIGRLVFCWFLKKKKSIDGISLIDEEILSTKAVKKHTDYYHAVLENLFFQTLNTPMTERLEDYKKGVHKNIPFLNGGLFEPHSDDFYKFNERTGKSVISFDLKIPDNWFVDFFEVLETYNFTIDENTSVDVDLSVDPEMLGRIFENLLAEINPETGETARKSTGSYYTPRSIVEYMVDESLKQYLKAKTNITDEKLSNLISYGVDEIHLSESDIKDVINAIDEVKILDPACGSGAFPIGILQKMLLILQKVDPDSNLWFTKMLDKIENVSMRSIIKSKFKNESLDYIRKLGIIQDAIYGMDIQTIAVEISKLRCFLTLIVDEDIDDEKVNRGIIPLPNLEFKFIAANTLISLQENEFNSLVQLANAPALRILKDKIIKLSDYKRQYFQASDIAIKKNIKKEYKELQTNIYTTTQSLRNSYPSISAFLDKVIMWDPFDISTSSTFFSPGWMFEIKNGFDIVIGNPPYLSAVTMARSEEQKTLFKKLYPFATGSYDIYILFLLRGISLIKHDGIYSWIIPNKFLIANYAKKTKDYLISDCGLITSVDVSTFDVFQEANVYPIIIMGARSVKQQFYQLKMKNLADLGNRKLISVNSQINYKTFKDYGIKISSGVTGFQASEIAEYVTSKSTKRSIPFIVSGSVDKYYWSNRNVRYMGTLYDEAFIPSSVNVSKSKWDFWLSPKIIVAGMTKEIEAVYSQEPVALGVGIYGIFDTGEFSPECLCGILNSRFMTSYVQTKFKDKHLAGGYLAINKGSIEEFPLVEIPILTQKRISTIVLSIQKSLKNNPLANVNDKMHQLDLLVYKLFGLKYEETIEIDPEIINYIKAVEYDKITII